MDTGFTVVLRPSAKGLFNVPFSWRTYVSAAGKHTQTFLTVVMVLLKMRHKVLDEPASSLHLFGAAETAPSDLSSRSVGNEGETRETARRRALRVEMPRDRARGGTAGLRARLLSLKANPGVRNAHSWRTGRASCTIPIIFLKDVTETRLRDGTGKPSGRSPLAGCRKAHPSWRGLLVE